MTILEGSKMNELDLVSISQMIDYFKRHKQMLASMNLIGLCSVNYVIKLLEEKREVQDGSKEVFN